MAEWTTDELERWIADYRDMCGHVEKVRDRPAVWMTVDPGVNAIGIAFWKCTDLAAKASDRVLPLDAFTLDPFDKTSPWNDRLRGIRQRLRRVLKERNWALQFMVSEFPIFFPGAKGSASLKQGDVLHVAACCGMLQCIAHENEASFLPVPVNLWIGQLPKRVTQMRVRKLVELNVAAGDEQADDILGSASHHWDAVGLGYWALGRWQ